MATVVSITNPITGAVEQVDKLDHTAQQIDDAVANAIPGGSIDSAIQAKPNPNLLDNWYFVNPVNQRGKTSYSGLIYGIDRWRGYSSASSVAVNDGYVSFSGVANSNILAQHRFDDGMALRLRGRTITISVLTDSPVWVTLITANPSASSPWGTNTRVATINYSDTPNGKVLYSATGVVPEDAERLAVNIVGKGASVEQRIYAVKAELGSQQTLAHEENGEWLLNEIPDYGDLLLRCQRYAHVYSTSDARPTNALDCVPHMRANPSQSTITSTDGSTLYLNTADL